MARRLLANTVKSLRDTKVGEVDAAVERQQERALARYEAEQDRAPTVCGECFADVGEESLTSGYCWSCGEPV